MDNNDYIQNIADELMGLVSTEWNRLLFYSEVDCGACQLYYCYQKPETKEFINFSQFPDVLGVTDDEINQMDLRLTYLVLGMHEQMVNDNSDWTAVTLQIENDLNFNIDYTYDDLDESSVRTRRKKWKEKYLQ